MSIQLQDLEYLKYIEPHLASEILEFTIKNHKEDENLSKMFKDFISKSQNFEKIKEYKIYDDKQIEEMKEKRAKEEEEFEEKLKGFLNLCENCKKQNNYDLNSFALGKKIIDETSPSLVIDYAKRLFDNGKCEEAKSILYSFAMLNEGNKKNISKGIFAFYLIYSLYFFTKQQSKIIESIFIQILSGVDKLKAHLDEEFKKVNFDSVEKIQIDFKQILLYRGYIIHWALFLLENNFELFLDTLLDDKYFTMIESVFPYMLKYLIVFTIISKSKKYLCKIKELVKNNPSFLENDIFVKLFKNIYIDYNIENFVALRKEIEAIMNNDYFLANYLKSFISKCNEAIIENYIIANEVISLKELCLVYEKDVEATKKKCIELIKFNFPLAKIDEANKEEIAYENDESEMDNYYKKQTEELYDLTKSMISFVKMNES